MKNLFILCYLFASIHTCLSEEFIYPVSSIDDNNVFIVHQKSIDDIELLTWDTQSKVATKQLTSLYLPSDVKILPSKQGFSFIDRGRIRIKRFQKRAPKTIDILEPINAILSIEWIDDDQFYFVGKSFGRYQIFLCDVADKSNAEILYLSHNKETDYIYPQKAENSLFAIAKDNNGAYKIVSEDWQPLAYETSNVDRQANNTQVAFQSQDPLCFLHMKTSKLGFVLKCNKESNEQFLNFSCLSCKKISASWHTEELFTFDLPIQYIIGESPQRLYESINPFIPHYNQDDSIYFTSYDQKLGKCTLHKYDLNSKKTIDSSGHISNNDLGSMSPLLFKDLVFHGYILPEKMTRNIIDTEQDSGVTYISLPCTTFIEKK